VSQSIADPLDPFDQVDPGKDYNYTLVDKICKNCRKMDNFLNIIFNTIFSIFKIALIIFLLIFLYNLIGSEHNGIAVISLNDNKVSDPIETILAHRLQYELQNIREINMQEIDFSNLGLMNHEKNSLSFLRTTLDLGAKVDRSDNQSISPIYFISPTYISAANWSKSTTIISNLNLSPISLPAIASPETYYDPGTIGVGGFSFNPAKLLYFLLDISNNDRMSITVEIQRFGHTQSILATLYDPRSFRTKTWEEIRTIPTANQTAEELLPSMIDIIAIKIYKDFISGDNALNDRYPHTWQAFKNLTEGREAYLMYKVTNNSRDLETASNMTLNAIHLEPSCRESFILLNGLCRVYLMKKQYDEAIRLFENISEIAPDDSSSGLMMVYSLKGNDLVARGENDLANKYYDNAIDLRPNEADIWNNKGNALFNLGRYNESVQAYENAIRLDPRNADIWNNIGIALAFQDKYDESIRALNNSIEIEPRNFESWNNKGNALIYLRKENEALDAYEEAIRLNPEIPEVLNNKGNILYYMNRYNEAKQTWEESYRVWRNSTSAIKYRRTNSQHI
jgi:tetratricopeptide (TPR) repeat protein